MALIKCPDCQQDVSAQVATCFHCGRSLRTPWPVRTPQTRYYPAHNHVPMFEQPDTRSKPVGTLSRYKTVKVLHRLSGARGDYYQVALPDGRAGFVFQSDLERVDERPAIAEKIAIVSAIIGVGILLLGFWGLMIHLSPEGRATATAQAQACENAVQRVRDYRAPEQARALDEVVAANLAADRRPKQLLGWSVWHSGPGSCAIIFRVDVGNDAMGWVWHTQQYTWRLDLPSGHVEASDSATKRLSGW
jgi:hypothetical protein